MTTSIISNEGVTTIKLIFNNQEKEEISTETEIDFLHTDNIEVIAPTLFKEHVLKLISNIEILDKK